MCNFFSSISHPNIPFCFLVSCFVDHHAMQCTYQERARTHRTTVDTTSGSSFLTTFNGMSQLRSGLLHRKRRNYTTGAVVAEDYGGHGYYYYPCRFKPGKKFDPRMLPLLESFLVLYFRRRDLFQRLFPTLLDEFAKFPEQLAAEVRSTNRELRRSQSMGSLRDVVSRDISGEEVALRLEWFKVQTVDIDDDLLPPTSAGTNKPTGSKSN